MKRDLHSMSNTAFDVLVIGGGITGATVAWDAALRGLRVALVEKSDFGRGTSSATSKRIHGGFEHVRRMELRRARRVMRERRIHSTISPHLVYPLPSLEPVYGWGQRLSLQATAQLYNALSYDRNRVPHDAQHIPTARVLNRERTLERIPKLPSEGLVGGMLHHDCQVYDPARHLLAFLHSAASHGARMANYAEVVDFVVEGDAVRGAVVHDHLTDHSHRLHAQVTVNATGPWIEGVVGLLDSVTAPSVRHSRGIHIVTKPITSLDQALVLQTPANHDLYVLPWRGHTLIGATDLPYEGALKDPMVTEADLRDFLDTINATFPATQLTRDDVEHFYGGLRPLMGWQATDDAMSTSHRDELLDHEENGVANLFTVMSSTYTTARGLAEKLVDRLFATLDRPLVPCTTHLVPTYGGDTGAFPHFLQHVKQRYNALPDATAYHLARSYGTRIADLMILAKRGPVLMQRPSKQSPDVMVQVDYAVEHEMAQTLEDVLFRRTGLGTLGEPSLDTLETVAQRMASLLQWSSQRFDDEVETMREYYLPPHTRASTSV